MFPSFPNFALCVFKCQFQGNLFGAILVHAHVLSVNAGPQHAWKPAVWIGFGLYLGVGYCKGLREGAVFLYFLWEIVQE